VPITHTGAVAIVYARANEEIETIPMLILFNKPAAIKNNIPTPTKALTI